MNIVLVGNPNVGKSVIFNAITKSYVTVSNYPGPTVDVSKGGARLAGKEYTVIDTPGVNSLVPHSEDEMVTKEILAKSDIAVIVQVADSKNLKRTLHLTLELAKLQIPLVLDLNMSDEARERGMKIDAKRLSEKLGIDVVETVAITGDGIPRLRDAITKARTPAPSRLETEPEKAASMAHPDIVVMARRSRIVDGLIRDVLTVSKPLRNRISETIGAITIRPLTGVPILLVVLWAMYLFVGQFAAGTAVDFFEKTVFGEILNPFFINMIDKFIPIEFMRELLVGDYGVITMAVTYALAIIFPIVTAFFIFFGILEDSGYLPRLSVLSDRIFRTMGLN